MYQNVEKRAKPANIAAYVSGNRLLRRPSVGEKKERKNIEYIVHTSDHFYLLHALVMYFVRIVIRRRELCLLN